ncbi:hypothetical protein GCM10023189_44550 [Nibrella saemangeumensis]|uniref:Uncharacterized protein n=1 Tax=Nibrella saemangeumensis TaxID=1084526 RepID=A0ABP8NG24_9BACT
METEAVKFTDLDAFLETMRAQGFDQQAEALVYEQGKLPYRSVFLIPVSLFPADFDWQTMIEFGGVVTQVREFEYIETEPMFTNFMVYPVSGIGYEEIEVHSSSNGLSANGEATPMAYVITLEDGIGRDYYLSELGNMVPFDQPSEEEPKVLKTNKRVDKIIDELSATYPASCKLFAVERKEFEKRRQLLQNPPQPKTKKKQ